MGCSSSELTARNTGQTSLLDIGDAPYLATTRRGDGCAYFTWKKDDEIMKISPADKQDPAARKQVTHIALEMSLENFYSLQMARGLF